MKTSERRYDIDWLRVITIGLLLIYHISIVFQPWGVFFGFIQSNQPLESLWIPMSLLNVWRIPLLFFVSGMGVGFAIRKRSWKQLLTERSRRILLPFLFGLLFIVPLHLFIWQQYYHQEIRYAPGPGHLWFLANIFIYVLLLSPLFIYLNNNKHGRLHRWIDLLLQGPAGLFFIIAAFVAETLIVKPESYEMYAMTWHGFFLGLLAFFFGFSCILAGSGFWKTVLKWRLYLLSAAMLLFVVRLVIFKLKAPGYLMAVESGTWIFAAFGFAYKYLNRPGKTLKYLSQGAYPVYILHMIFLYVASYLLIPLDIPVIVKFILVVVITAGGCLLTYDLLIRRVRFMRLLFGLKIK